MDIERIPHAWGAPINYTDRVISIIIIVFTIYHYYFYTNHRESGEEGRGPTGRLKLCPGQVESSPGQSLHRVLVRHLVSIGNSHPLRITIGHNNYNNYDDDYDDNNDNISPFIV